MRTVLGVDLWLACTLDRLSGRRVEIGRQDGAFLDFNRVSEVDTAGIIECLGEDVCIPAI